MQLRQTCSSAPRLPALAQPDRRAERVARAAVVARDLVRGAEPLVDLGGLRGQLVLEREGEAGADDLDAVVVRAALDPRDALEPHRAGAQVGAIGAHRLGPRPLGRRRRLGVEPRALQVAGDDEPLGRRLARQAVRRVGLRRDAARGERPLAIALQRVDARDAPLGVGERPAGAGGPARGDDLALRTRRLPELTGELGVDRVALDDRETLRSPLALGPDVERLPPEAGGVAVRVHRGGGRDRVEQRLERARRVARREPVRGHLRRVRVRARGAPRPGAGAACAGAARARRRRSPRGRADAGTRHGPRPPRGSARRRAARRARPRRRSPRPARGRTWCRAPPRSRPPPAPARRAMPSCTSTASRIVCGIDTSPSSASSGPSGPSGSRDAGAQRRRHLLDEERHAGRARVERRGEPRRRPLLQDLLDEARRVRGVERGERQLVEHPVAAQVVAQPPQRMRPRQLVGAVAGDDEQRQVGEARRQRGEELERRLVRPLQVVEEHRGRAVGDDRHQPAADRLEQRRAVVGGARVAQLGEQQREMRAQRAAARAGRRARSAGTRAAPRPRARTARSRAWRRRG